MTISMDAKAGAVLVALDTPGICEHCGRSLIEGREVVSISRDGVLGRNELFCSDTCADISVDDYLNRYSWPNNSSDRVNGYWSRRRHIYGTE